MQYRNIGDQGAGDVIMGRIQLGAQFSRSLRTCNNFVLHLSYEIQSMGETAGSSVAESAGHAPKRRF